jgi:hypothetical protein
MNSVEETARRLREFFEAAVRKSTDAHLEAPTQPYSLSGQSKPPILRVYEECLNALAPGEPAELDRLIRKMSARLS